MLCDGEYPLIRSLTRRKREGKQDCIWAFHGHFIIRMFAVTFPETIYSICQILFKPSGGFHRMLALWIAPSSSK